MATCRVCRDELTDDNTTIYDTHPDCMPTFHRQFYAQLHRYRARHPNEHIDWEG
jgi:hypothetical protein